jgi:hypothetical protein
MESQPEKYKELLKRLERIFPPQGGRDHRELKDRIDFLLRLLRAKVGFEMAASFASPLVVVVAGGTNVGKSEVFNALAGKAVAQPDPRAGMTRRPAVFGRSAHRDVVENPGFLMGYARSALENPDDLNRSFGESPVFHFRLEEGEDGADLLLVDSPDIDSNRTENLGIARGLLAQADLVVFVTSPSKYNDEACVTFLRLARGLGKRVFVAFNFLGDDAEKVLEDFRTSVLGAQGADGTDVTEIPRFPKGTAVLERMSEHVGELGAGLGSLGSRDVKVEGARKALAYVRTEFGDVFRAVEKDLENLAALQKRTEEEAARHRQRYEADLAGEKFVELELVITEVLDHFAVPVIDDVLKAPGRAVKWIFRRMQGRDSERSEAQALMEQRRERDRRRLAEAADAVRAELMKSLAEGSADPLMGEVMRRASAGPLGRSTEKKAEAVWAEMEPKFAAWKDGMRSEMIEKIQDSPNLKAFLRGSKALLQIGSGVLAAVLTGGVGPVDLVVGPLAAKVTQYALETFGSAYFQGKRQAYTALHLERFDAVIRRCVTDPLEEAFPARPDEEAIRGAREALASFRIPIP